MKRFLMQNRSKVAIGLLGLSVIGASVYWLIKKARANSKSIRQNDKPAQCTNKSVGASTIADNEPQQPDPQSYQSKFARAVNEIRKVLDSSSGQLTPEVIATVFRCQYDLADQDMIATTHKARREQRQKIDDHIEYARIVTKYQLQFQELQEKHLGSILARFNIDRVTWNEAQHQWQQKQEENGGNFSDLIQQLEQKQLLNLRKTNIKAKDFALIEKILKFKIKNLQVLNPSELGVELGADEAARYNLVETYINDLTFLKFNLEAEDIEYSISQMEKDEKQKIIEYESKIGELTSSLAEGSEQDKESDFY